VEQRRRSRSLLGLRLLRFPLLRRGIEAEDPTEAQADRETETEAVAEAEGEGESPTEAKPKRSRKKEPVAV